MSTAGGALVLLSGGLDSTVCLAVARRQAHPVVALTVDYGQRHRVELERAAAVAARLGTEHLVVRVDLSPWAGSALTDPSVEVPDAARGTEEGIPVTYVPARNLIFLALAAGVAEARAVDHVYIGVNSLDYSGYPDCRPEFIDAFRTAAGLALKRGVEGRPLVFHTPLVDLTKAAIVRLGVDVAAPLDLTWSCYRGGPRPCGRCDACALRARGFAEARLVDPALT
jgi:7-cyano-7-deazaguanine synthase